MRLRGTSRTTPFVMNISDHKLWMERRRKPRIDGPFRGRARGVDCGGNAFDVETCIENLSVAGLYTRLSRNVDSGARMFFVLHIPSFPCSQESGTQFVARAQVRRVERRSNGTCCVGVEFRRYRQV